VETEVYSSALTRQRNAVTALKCPPLRSTLDHLSPELLLLLLGHGNITVRKRSTLSSEATHGLLVGVVEKSQVLVLKELGLLLRGRIQVRSVRVEDVGIGRQLLERGPDCQ
jgi:hypothetical protein